MNCPFNAFLPFTARLSQVPLIEGNTTICNHSLTTTFMVGDATSASEFFVGVAVVCFLYSMVALLVYLGYMHVYKDSDFGPIFVSIDHHSIGNCRPVEPVCSFTSYWSSSSGFCADVHPGLPVAGLLVGVGEGSAEREGRHGQSRHQGSSGCLSGRKHYLQGHGVRRHERPQLLCGEKIVPQNCCLNDFG